MFRTCVIPTCEHYGLHRIRTRRSGLDIQCCHGHLSWMMLLLKRMCPRDHVEVATSSAVVVGDIRDWRTRSITAYDAHRQIGA